MGPAIAVLPFLWQLSSSLQPQAQGTLCSLYFVSGSLFFFFLGAHRNKCCCHGHVLTFGLFYSLTLRGTSVAFKGICCLLYPSMLDDLMEILPDCPNIQFIAYNDPTVTKFIR